MTGTRWVLALRVLQAAELQRQQKAVVTADTTAFFPFHYPCLAADAGLFIARNALAYPSPVRIRRT